MTAFQKYKEEKEDAKTERKRRILSSAFELFSERGIDSIAITDIANKAEIGVASIYRYYETKEQIAINTAIWAWREQADFIFNKISNENYDKLPGIKKIETICNVFLDLFLDKPDFLRFIYFFDSYVYRQNIEKQKFAEYEENIKSIQKKIVDAIQFGLTDNTIRVPQGFSENDLYYTMMHSLFSTTQKLSLSEDMLVMNKDVAAKKQIELLIKMLLNSIRA